jgi:TRAP-type C4-dicarboxylate transport system permease small subunit
MKRDPYLFLLLIFLAVSGVLSVPARYYVGDPYAWREESRAILLRWDLGKTYEFVLVQP